MAKASVISSPKAEKKNFKKEKLKLKKSKDKSKNEEVKILPLDPQKEKKKKPKSENGTIQPKKEKVEVLPIISIQKLAERYPLFKDKELIKKFTTVKMSSNQKGRISQSLRRSLKGTSDSLRSDMIHLKLKAIVNGTDSITEPDLRKIRILFNMLRTTIQTEDPIDINKKDKRQKQRANKKLKISNGEGVSNSDGLQANTESKVIDDDTEEMSVDKENRKRTTIQAEETVNNTKKNKKRNKKDKTSNGEGVNNSNVQDSDTESMAIDEDTEEMSDKKEKKKKDKLKGPKRYVVFVGNLPLDVDKEKIMGHFAEFKDYVVDVRIPKPKEGKKSTIAYVELKNEPSYELALSKHHSMLGNKRINVLYSTQQNSKISKAEAKGKAAKLIALQKSGQLMGSIPMDKKRSHRRLKAKQAKAKLEAEA